MSTPETPDELPPLSPTQQRFISFVISHAVRHEPKPDPLEGFIDRGLYRLSDQPPVNRLECRYEQTSDPDKQDGGTVYATMEYKIDTHNVYGIELWLGGTTSGGRFGHYYGDEEARGLKDSEENERYIDYLLDKLEEAEADGKLELIDDDDPEGPEERLRPSFGGR